MIDHIALAKEFVRQLTTELTPEELARVRVDNAAETLPNVCHSHDHLDANMTMLSACERLGIDVWTDDGNEVRDEVTALWNAAWHHATTTYLTA